MSRKVLVTTGHDETNHTLEKDSNSKRLSRTNPIAHISSKRRAGNVEKVGQSGPAEGHPQRRAVAHNDAQPLRGIDAERVA